MIETLKEQLLRYTPLDDQEASDRDMMLEALSFPVDPFTRENRFAHFTASSWIVNPDHTRVLMVWHNIYQSWSWTGGHADGERDLLSVALREAKEETGIERICPLLTDVYSLEILHVPAHYKRGKYVSTHLHLNATYLLEADDAQSLTVKPDENSAVMWKTLPESETRPEEPQMNAIYHKLNQKLPL